LPPIDNSASAPTAQPYNHVGASAINTSDMYGGIPGVDNSMTMGTGLAPTVAPSPDGLNPSIPSGVSSTPVPQDVRSAYEAAVKSAQERRKNGFMGQVVLPGEGRYEDFVKLYNHNLLNPKAQPTLGGNVGGDNLMGVLPTGGVTSGQMPPGFTPLPPGELGFTENMVDHPFEAYAGGSKYFDESTGLYTGPESYRNQDSLSKFAQGGIVSLRKPVVAKFNQGGIIGFKEGRYLDGNTDGMADEKPAMIDGEEPALLSDGEFVIPADVVSHLGNGNSDAGARVLEEMMARVRKARTGSEEQGAQIDPNDFLPV